MTETKKAPSGNLNFPTDAKPVFVKAGLLVAVISAVLVYMWFDNRPQETKNMLKEVPEDIKEILAN